MAEGDPVKQTLMDINFNLPDEITQYNGQPLTSFERSELQRFMSMDVEFRKDLETLINNPRFKEQVQEYKDRGLLNRDGARVSDTPFYNAVRKIFNRAKERAIQQLRYEYPDLDQRLSLAKTQKSLTQKGDFNTVEYLINKFPK